MSQSWLQVRVYIVDVAHWASFNEIYARWAGDAKPARASCLFRLSTLG